MSTDHSSHRGSAHEHGQHTAMHPVFNKLGDADIHAILERNHIGRLAFTLHDRVDIQPVHYVYNDNWLYGRTEPGTKLATIEHHPWVAFEVDEVKDLFDWQSVVVHGTFEVLDENWHKQETLNQAASILRRLIPETLTPNDPVPFRNILFRVYVSHASGRSCHLEASQTT